MVRPAHRIPRPSPARRLLRVGLLLALAGWVLLAALPVRWAYWTRLENVPIFWQRIGPARDAMYRLEDPVRRLLSGYAAPDTLPVLRFALADSAARRWEDQLDSIRVRGINVAVGRRWIPAALGAGTEVRAEVASVSAEVAWHGKFRRHWGGRQRSLKVRLGGGASWWGLRDFTLLTPDNRDGPGLLLAAQLARAAGVWHPRVRVVRVEVNGTDWGLHYAEEPIDAAFLARRGLPDGALLAPRATWADDFPDHRRAPAYGQGVGFNRASHVHSLALEPAFQEVSASSDSLAAVARGQWARVRDLVMASASGSPAGLPDSTAVAAVFDVDAWGAADALRHLLADRHNLAGDNLHVAYDFRTGRFRPIYRFEGGLVAAERSKGLTNASTLSYNGSPLPLWRFVNQQPALRLAKLRALYRLTATPARVEAALRAAGPATVLLTHAPGAQYPIRQRRWHAEDLRRVLRGNRTLIHRSLTEDAWLYGTVRVVGAELRLELLPETEGALLITEVRVRGRAGWRRLAVVGNRPILAGVGPVGSAGEQGLVPTVIPLTLPWTSPAAPSALLVRGRNLLSGQLLPAHRVRVTMCR